MSDLKLTLGLDDSRFTRGMRKVDAAADGVARRVERGWRERLDSIQRVGRRVWPAIEKGIAATGAAAVLAGRMIDRYADKFSFARGEADALSASISRFQDALGRDLVGVGAGSALAEVIDTISAIRQELTDTTAVAIKFGDQLFGSPANAAAAITGMISSPGAFLARTGAEIDAVSRGRLAQEAAETAVRQAAAARELELEFRAGVGGRAGLEARAQLSLERALKELDERAARGEISRAAQSEFVVLARSARDRQLAEFDATQRRDAGDQLRRRDERIEDRRLQLESVGVDRLRLQGREREADALEEQLRLRRELIEIDRDELVNERVKAELRSKAIEGSRLRLQLSQQGDTTRGQAIEPGISPAIAVAALGVGVPAQQLTVQTRIAQTVSKIEAKIGKGAGVF